MNADRTLTFLGDLEKVQDLMDADDTDPALLAQAVMELYRERTVRIYRGTQQYITEEQEWK